jgi:hypothetical protein
MMPIRRAPPIDATLLRSFGRFKRKQVVAGVWSRAPWTGINDVLIAIHIVDYIFRANPILVVR